MKPLNDNVVIRITETKVKNKLITGEEHKGKINFKVESLPEGYTGTLKEDQLVYLNRFAEPLATEIIHQTESIRTWLEIYPLTDIVGTND